MLLLAGIPLAAQVSDLLTQAVVTIALIALAVVEQRRPATGAG